MKIFIRPCLHMSTACSCTIRCHHLLQNMPSGPQLQSLSIFEWSLDGHPLFMTQARTLSATRHVSAISRRLQISGPGVLLACWDCAKAPCNVVLFHVILPVSHHARVASPSYFLPFYDRVCIGVHTPSSCNSDMSYL